MPNKSPAKKLTNEKTSYIKRVCANKVFVALGCFVLIVLAVFVFRGWVRVTVMPKSVGVFYASGVKNALANENVSLQYPLAQLGYTTASNHAACNLELAQSVHTDILCSRDMQAYTKVPLDSAGKTKLENNAQNIQTLLAKNGWQGGSNGVILTSLIDGIYTRIDSSPDAYYEKVTGSYDCVFDTMIAYANPNPPAINSTFSCSRTVNILGTPTGEFYSSSKGHY